MTTPVDCLVEASAALTRYRILTQGTRPSFEDLTIYEWLTSLVPDRAIKDTPEQVMHRVITEHKYLWAPSAYADHWAQGEIDRVSELLDELGYGVDELSDDEPTCDVCGKHTEDAVWCGSCGCCREHCAGFADCDEEDS